MAWHQKFHEERMVALEQQVVGLEQQLIEERKLRIEESEASEIALSKAVRTFQVNSCFLLDPKTSSRKLGFLFTTNKS